MLSNALHAGRDSIRWCSSWMYVMRRNLGSKVGGFAYISVIGVQAACNAFCRCSLYVAPWIASFLVYQHWRENLSKKCTVLLNQLSTLRLGVVGLAMSIACCSDCHMADAIPRSNLFHQIWSWSFIAKYRRGWIHLKSPWNGVALQWASA